MVFSLAKISYAQISHGENPPTSRRILVPTCRSVVLHPYSRTRTPAPTLLDQYIQSSKTIKHHVEVSKKLLNRKINIYKENNYFFTSRYSFLSICFPILSWRPTESLTPTSVSPYIGSHISHSACACELLRHHVTHRSTGLRTAIRRPPLTTNGWPSANPTRGRFSIAS